MRHELLLEIGTEEIPAGFIGPALNSLQGLLAARLDDLGLDHGEIRTEGTPRRLVLVIHDLADRQPDRREQSVGPSVKAAFDVENQPTRAAIGFAASKGGSVDDLQVISTPKGEYVALVLEKKGEATEKILSELLPQVITGLPFAKSMRWGAGALSFARPVHWLVALYGGKVVPFAIGNIASGKRSRGHRFMAPEEFEVETFDQYLETLRQKEVLVDRTERRALVVEEVERAAKAAGGAILVDEELVETVMDLVELPCGVGGVFDQRFLELPDAVLITAMREHQKYFCVVDDRGALLPSFVALNNTRVVDGRLAAEGHQRVLRARLEDAFFFFKDDQARPLADRVADLDGLIFQARLGTMAEKTERLGDLAALLVHELKLAPDQAALVDRAAFLAKADLLTAMVGEFPSLQGMMGRDYALLAGEDPEVAEAIAEHYMPVRAGGQLPASLVGSLVSLADRLDTIVGCFGIGRTPTGTTDPFGLRRLALGFLHIVEGRSLVFGLRDMVEVAIKNYDDKLTEEPDTIIAKVLEFIKGRFVNDLVARGIPVGVVEAATSVDFDDLVDCRARIDALAAIRNQPTFAALATAFKRLMNIVKDNEDQWVDSGLFQEAAEQELYDAFLTVKSEIDPYLDQRQYGPALEVILTMKEPVDRFFDQVMVMAEDQGLRANRLNMLTAIGRLFLRIGDFSKIQVEAAG